MPIFPLESFKIDLKAVYDFIVSVMIPNHIILLSNPPNSAAKRLDCNQKWTSCVIRSDVTGNVTGDVR